MPIKQFIAYQFLKVLLCAILIKLQETIFLVVVFALMLSNSFLCKWDQFAPCALCHVPCDKALRLDQVCINNGFILGYHVLIFCIFLCVQVSLWMLILMIIGHIRNLYTWESAYPSLISFRFLAGPWNCVFLFFGGSGKRLSSECLYVLHISLHSWVVGYILDPCLVKWWSYFVHVVSKYKTK